MKKEFKNYLIQQAKEGNFETIEKLVDVMSPRLIEKVAPEEIKQKATAHETIHVTKVLRQDGEQAYYTELDPIEAMLQFHERCTPEAAVISQYETKILGGDRSTGWKFDESLEDAELIQMKVNDPSAINCYPFISLIEVEVVGHALMDYTPEMLETQLRKEFKPQFLFAEVINPEIKITELSLACQKRKK